MKHWMETVQNGLKDKQRKLQNCLMMQLLVVIVICMKVLIIWIPKVQMIHEEQVQSWENVKEEMNYVVSSISFESENGFMLERFSAKDTFEYEIRIKDDLIQITIEDPKTKNKRTKFVHDSGEICNKYREQIVPKDPYTGYYTLYVFGCMLFIVSVYIGYRIMINCIFLLIRCFLKLFEYLMKILKKL